VRREGATINASMAWATLRRSLALTTVSAGVLAYAACTTDYQKGLDDPNYGPPNALVGKKQPGPSSESLDGGGGAAAGGTGVPECVRAGGTLVDAGAPCAISFRANILESFKAATCNTSGSCHGGTDPPNQPRIDPADAPAMWTEFAAFKLSNGKLYINPCSTDPAQSGIACNVNKDAPCGVVMPPGGGFPPNSIADIETWLKCGAPNN